MKFSLTPSNIAKIIEGELPGAMWEFYIGYREHVEKEGGGGKSYFTSAESRQFDLSLPHGMRLVHTYMRFDGDVLNGGLGQYFGNHSPDEVYEDLAALKTIGATESARILEEAIAVLKLDYGWPSDDLKTCAYDYPGDHPEIVRLNDLRCNDESSRRDYALLNDYLQQHLHDCVIPVDVECCCLEEFLRPA